MFVNCICVVITGVYHWQKCVCKRGHFGKVAFWLALCSEDHDVSGGLT